MNDIELHKKICGELTTLFERTTTMETVSTRPSQKKAGQWYASGFRIS